MHLAIDLLAFVVDVRIARSATPSGPGEFAGYFSLVLGRWLHVHVEGLAPFVVIGKRRVGMLRWERGGPWIPSASGSLFHVETFEPRSARRSYKDTMSDACHSPADYTMAPRAKAAA